MTIALEAMRVRDDKLIRELLDMNLDPDEFVVFGSAPLLAHGLRARVRDLDIVARGDVMRWARETGVRGVGTYSGDPVWQFNDGRIQFSTGWITSSWDADDLIENAETIEGLRFARISDVLRYKKELRRPKDRVDIALIRAYQGESGGDPGDR